MAEFGITKEEQRLHNLLAIEKRREIARRLRVIHPIAKGVRVRRLCIETPDTEVSVSKIVRDIVRKSELEEYLMK